MACNRTCAAARKGWKIGWAARANGILRGSLKGSNPPSLAARKGKVVSKSAHERIPFKEANAGGPWEHSATTYWDLALASWKRWRRVSASRGIAGGRSIV